MKERRRLGTVSMDLPRAYSAWWS